MRKAIVLLLLAMGVVASGCLEAGPPTQTQKLQANQLATISDFSLEREALIKWYKTVNDPYAVHWVYQFSEGTGALIFKSPVIGTVVSVQKSLNPTERAFGTEYGSEVSDGRLLPGALRGTFELMDVGGTYGDELDGVFFFTPDGTYIELHGGIIIVASQPISVQEPVLNINNINEEDAKKTAEYEATLKDPAKNPMLQRTQGGQ